MKTAPRRHAIIASTSAAQEAVARELGEHGALGQQVHVDVGDARLERGEHGVLRGEHGGVDEALALVERARDRVGARDVGAVGGVLAAHVEEEHVGGRERAVVGGAGVAVVERGRVVGRGANARVGGVAEAGLVVAEVAEERLDLELGEAGANAAHDGDVRVGGDATTWRIRAISCGDLTTRHSTSGSKSAAWSTLKGVDAGKFAAGVHGAAVRVGAAQHVAACGRRSAAEHGGRARRHSGTRRRRSAARTTPVDLISPIQTA
jgi:hypothetical protein